MEPNGREGQIVEVEKDVLQVIQVSNKLILNRPATLHSLNELSKAASRLIIATCISVESILLTDGLQ